MKRLNRIYNDYEYRNFITSALSFLLTIAFLVYNFTIGIIYKLTWNFSISFYYLVLVLIRGIILLLERKWNRNQDENITNKRVVLYRFVCFLLIFLDLSLIIPISLMVLNERAVNVGTIPAITVAAYTTYKTVFAILNYKKTRRSSNLSLHLLKVVSLMDAGVSILTLQNTLTMVFSNGNSIIGLTSVSSGAMLLFMILLTGIHLKKSMIKK